MIIKESDFEMELVEDSTRYDLSISYVVHAKDPEKRREELKLIGYAMPLETCIDLIILHRLKRKQEVYCLKTFLLEYKKESAELRQSISLKV